MKQKLTKLKGEIDNSTIIVGNFNIPLTIMDRTTRRKKGNRGFNIINQLDLTDKYRTLYPTTEYTYTFFSSVHGTFSRTDHILGHKLSLNRLRKINIIQNIFSDHNKMKLETNNKSETGKSTNLWKLNNTLFNNQRIKEEITWELQNP